MSFSLGRRLRVLLRLYRSSSLFGLVALLCGGQRVTAQPNLVPQNVILSSYGESPGDVITVDWTMANTGSSFAFATFTALRFGISPTSVPLESFSDVTFTTPEIAAKSSVHQSVSVTIPTDILPGTYYLWVVADVLGSSGQSSTLDDAARSAAFTVQNVRGQPNLLPLNIALNTGTVLPGGSLAVAWTLTNSGSVRCPASYTGLHLGTSRLTPPNGDTLNVQVPTPEIAPNSAMRFTNIVTIPPGTLLGTYYLWVVADDVPDSTLNQSSRSDDAARSVGFSVASSLPQPNLVTLDVSLSSYSAQPGNLLSVMWTLTNAGASDCPASITGLHLGASPTQPPSGDLLSLTVSTPAVPAGSSVRLTNTVTIPANTPPGNYYLWVVADDVAQSTLGQSSRADDAARSGLLSITQFIAQPNLAPKNVLLSSDFARAGDQVTVRWTMRNTGAATAPRSVTGLIVGPSASAPPTNGLVQLLLQTPEIAAGTQLEQTNVVTIPANAPVGTNFVWIIADDVANSTLNQSSRDDDTARSAPLVIVTTLPRPNLAPTNITLSAGPIAPGSQLVVSWAMTNSGNENCPASTTGLHLGTSSTSPPAGDSVNLKVLTPPINAQSGVRQSNTISIPANTAPGIYYLWVVADDVPNSALNQISKSDDAARSGPFAVVVAALTFPASGGTVDSPPRFYWTAPGTPNVTVYLANKPGALPGTDPVAFVDAAPGTSELQLSLTNWVATVSTLGLAQNYYWTIGTSDPQQRLIFADWRPFKARPLLTGGNIVPASDRKFRFTVLAPNAPQLAVQGSQDLVHWITLPVVTNSTGSAVITDDAARNLPKRFYRAQQ